MIALKRGQIGKAKGRNCLDVTVKSAAGWATAFAPTWEMVAKYKSGTITDSEYVQLYETILNSANEVFIKLRQFGLDNKSIKFLCYCPSGTFCHTNILIDFATKHYPDWFTDGRNKPTRGKEMIKYLLGVDLETTGLKAGYNEITQIGAILLDKGLNELGSFETFVRIDYPERGLEGGFNVFEYTGINPESLKTAPLLKDALRALEVFVRSKINDLDLSKVIVFGQNPTFDVGFLRAAFDKLEWKYPFDFRVIALESMYVYHHLLRTGELPEDIALRDICKVAGVENKKAHSALADIRATVDVLHKLCTPIVPKAKKVKTDEATEESPKPTPRRRTIKKG